MRDGVRAAGCARVALGDPRKACGSGAAISQSKRNKITRFRVERRFEASGSRASQTEI